MRRDRIRNRDAYALMLVGAIAVLLGIGIGHAVTQWFTALNAAAIAGGW